MSGRSSLLSKQLPPFTLLMRHLHCPQERTLLQFQRCPLTQGAVLWRHGAWPCGKRPKKVDEPANCVLSKSLSVHCFIPPEFVGARLAPKQPLVYSLFPPIQAGTSPQEEVVLTQAVACSCGHCGPLSPGMALVPC